MAQTPRPSLVTDLTETSPPLVVDLDGTLVKTDLLLETASRFVTRHPWQTGRLLGWLLAGKPVLKARLAEACPLDPAHLPYREDLLAWLRQQRTEGRSLVLATASHRRLAEPLARHLGLFDQVLASDGQVNLSGERKRACLVEGYGQGGFDYVGNSQADVPVWRAARRAYLVSSNPALIAQVGALGKLAQRWDDGRPPRHLALLRAARPHLWVKNLLLLVPLLVAHRYGDGASLAAALLALLVFSLATSSVYLLNDLADLAEDRRHRRKRQRPCAAGDLSLLDAWLAWPLLLLTAFGIGSMALPWSFLALLAGYFLATLAYSLWLKRLVLVDVLTLAGLYTLRIFAGALVIGVPVSFWLLAFSLFFFLSLAFLKRFSELKSTRLGNKASALPGRGYRQEDLEMVSSLGTGAGYLSILVLALYIQDQHTAQLYHRPEFIWLACPLLWWWLSRAWLIAHRGEMRDDPVLFALQDRGSWTVAAGFLLAFGLARVLT